MRTIAIKRHIMITGLSGFVGSNLQKYLRNDFEIQSNTVRFVPDQKFVLNCSAIVHLAGKAHDLKKVSKPNEYLEANYELTKQLFDSFIDSDVKIFIFMSTVKAVADKVQGILTEDSTANPKTHYGITKRLAEEYILGKELPEDKRVYILRPCMIHGQGNKGNLNLLYQVVSKGLPWPLGAFENQRSFLSVENLCFVIKEMLNNEAIPSGVFHIADDQSLSTNGLIRLLGTALHKKTRIWRISPYWIRKISKIGDYFPFPINSERLQKLTENYVVSNEKIKRAINKELPVSTEEGMIQTFHSFSNS